MPAKVFRFRYRIALYEVICRNVPLPKPLATPFSMLMYRAQHLSEGWVNLNKRQKCPIDFRAAARPELLLSCSFMPSAAHP